MVLTQGQAVAVAVEVVEVAADVEEDTESEYVQWSA